MMRSAPRRSSGLREITIEKNYIKHPEGSCLIRMGQTWVLCNASIEEKLPPWLERKGQGWVTAEYSMLPRATNTRTRREASTGRPNGRTQEIQRLIGRALRAAIDLKALGERTITIDCDVLQADGGTRTASINGGFIALALATQHLQKKGLITNTPIRSYVGAVSIGIHKGEVLVDLDYQEDSNCEVDMNVVMVDGAKFVELQGTAEKDSFSKEQSIMMLDRATEAIREVMEIQRACLSS